MARQLQAIGGLAVKILLAGQFYSVAFGFVVHQRAVEIRFVRDTLQVFGGHGLYVLVFRERIDDPSASLTVIDADDFLALDGNFRVHLLGALELHDERAPHARREGDVYLRLLGWTIATALLALAFAVIYYWAPDLKTRCWHWLTPGGAIGIVAWLLASLGLRIYLHYYNSYSVTYGSLGAAMILLMWLYITGFSFLIGGEINAQIEHAAAVRGHPEAKAPGEKKAA